MIRTYSDLCRRSTFLERFRYLSLGGVVGEDTFGSKRYLNQLFYKSSEWLPIRDKIIIRDEGCDLGIPGRIITGSMYIHHLNPITIRDLECRTEYLLDPEFLIVCSFETHNAIHYGDESLLLSEPIVRRPNDTCPWKT